MSKFIVYNKSKINDNDAVMYATETVKRYKSELKAIGNAMYLEYCDCIYGLIKVEIIKNKTCYTIVIY